MPQCVTACKCALGGCSSSAEQEEFLESTVSKSTTTTGNTSGDEEFPPCVTPAFNGEDQVSSNIHHIHIVLEWTRNVLILTPFTCQFYHSAAADQVLNAWELREPRL